MKLASDKATADVQTESYDGEERISWQQVGDADGYIVKKYSDANCSNKISESDVSDLSYTVSVGTADCYYTVTPYVESEAGRLNCKESDPVKVSGKPAKDSNTGRLVVDGKTIEGSTTDNDRTDENKENMTQGGNTGERNQNGNAPGDSTVSENTGTDSNDTKTVPTGRTNNRSTISSIETLLFSMKKDKDIAGSRIAPLLLKSSRQTKNSIKLRWKKVKGASKYVVYGNACGSGNRNKLKKLKQTNKVSFNAKKAAKKIRKGKYYKFIVVAADENNNLISVSKMIHVATKGSKKAGNPKKVTVKAKIRKNGKKTTKYKHLKRTILKKGRSLRLKAYCTKPKKKIMKKHNKMRYESSNAAVAAVSSKGRIRAKAKGTAKIYVYAQNGIHKTIRITVK